MEEKEEFELVELGTASEETKEFNPPGLIDDLPAPDRDV